jgi:exonuclease III
MVDLNGNCQDLSTLSKDISSLKIISINMNSMNISTPKNSNRLTKLDQKLNFILRDNPDIILMQDLRLCDKKNESIVNKKTLCHRYGNYIFYLNSSKNKRGVGFLFKRSLNYKIVAEIKSNCENYYIMNIKINKSTIALASTYGPKQQDDRNFFNTLYNDIVSLKSDCFLILGDLNCVTDISPPNINSEIFNMNQLPNPNHCKIINKLMQEGKVFDIFRSFHPEKKEFSYTPFELNPNIVRNNMSRIDNALGCSKITEITKSINYINTPSLFDHKCISISFKERKKKPLQIDNLMLDIAGLNELVRVSILDAINDHLINKIDEELLTNLRIVADLIKKLGLFSASQPQDKWIKLLIDEKIQKFSDLSKTLPSTDNLINSGIDIEPILFYRVVMNNAMNELISYQITFKKAENNYINNLTLLASRCQNIYEKRDLEKEIKRAEDKKLEINCRKYKLWRAVNFEKPTRSFCMIAKKAKENHSLEEVKNHDSLINGIPKNFNLKSEWANYCLDYYKKLYEQPAPKLLSLNDFLGEEIQNHPSTQNLKLNEGEKTSLCGPIRLEELQEAAKNAKSGSAGGPDGVGYNFYKKFFDLLGTPVLNCFNEMSTVHHKLMEPYNSVKLLLIPKKGDISNIKNWRGISLNYTGYKLYSSAITARLKKVIDKCIYVEQKGYSKTKVISEVVLNIFNRISGSKNSRNSNKKTAVLAIDFSKAFDKILHPYLLELLSWYNFPECFIDKIKTILTNRKAFICNIDDQSKTINILSGIPQGDSISCYLFILGLMPLLMKFKFAEHILNERLNSINNIEAIGPISAENIINNEHLIETLEITAFTAYADDLSILFTPSPESLRFIIHTMEEFYKLSGLLTNFDKTKVLFCQPPTEETKQILNENKIEIEESITVLGFSFNSDLSNLQENIDKCIEKITSLASFFKKMYLSLMGRVAMANCYLISQLSYLFAVISPTNDQIKKIDDIIFGFVKGKSRISKTAIQTLKVDGGLGIPSSNLISKFMKLNIFCRHFQIVDNWSLAIKNCRVDQTHLLYRLDNIISDDFTFSKNILEVFMEFSIEYYKCKERILSTPLKNLSLFQEILPKNYYTDFRNFLLEISTPGNELINDGRRSNPRLCVLIDIYAMCIKQKNDLEMLLNANISNANYFRFRNIVNYIIDKYKIDSNHKLANINEVVSNVKEGSKRFKIFYLRNYNANDKSLKARQNMCLYHNEFPDTNENEKREKGLISFTTNSCLSNDFKEFCFKFRMNLLYPNSQISKFTDQSAGCNQCAKTYEFSPPEKETTLHMLFNCPALRKLKDSLINCENSLAFINDVRNCLLGSNNANPSRRMFENCIIMSFHFAWYKHRNVDGPPTNISELVLFMKDNVDFGLVNKMNYDAIKLFNDIIIDNNWLNDSF